jgi:hypothetical protein
MEAFSNQTQLTTSDIIKALGQLGPVDLETIAHHVSELRTRKTTGQEAELLKIVLKRRLRSFQKWYRELMERRQDEMLREAEYQELLQMTEEAEAFDTRRNNALVALAELRNTDLDTLMRELGLLQRG